MRKYLDLTKDNFYTLANFLGVYALNDSIEFLDFLENAYKYKNGNVCKAYYKAYYFEDAKKDFNELLEISCDDLNELNIAANGQRAGYYLDGLSFQVEGLKDEKFNVQLYIILRVEYPTQFNELTGDTIKDGVFLSRSLLKFSELKELYFSIFGQSIKQVVRPF